MKGLVGTSVAICLSALAVVAGSQQAPRRAVPDAEPANQTVKQYCIGCHSERGKAGGLSLVDFEVARSAEHPDTSEKIIRKLRTGMMPPAGARRPDDISLQALRSAIETRMEQWAAA